MRTVIFCFTLGFLIFSPFQFSSAQAESGARGISGSVPALSYCAHWFSRDGKACLSTARSGEQVAVNAFDAPDLALAVNTCRTSGCKITLYCECASSSDVARLASVYSSLVTRYGGQMFLPYVEVDGIRDLSLHARTDVADALKRSGYALTLKNMANVDEMSVRVPIARVVYEDLVNNTTYATEFKALAQSHPTLLITGIVHQGGYDGDSGSTLERAHVRFKEFESFRNVELFYGTPTTFTKIKAFDGTLENTARGVGSGGMSSSQQSTNPLTNLFSNTPTSVPSLLSFLQQSVVPASLSSSGHPSVGAYVSSLFSLTSGWNVGTQVPSSLPVVPRGNIENLMQSVRRDGEAHKMVAPPNIVPVTISNDRGVIESSQTNEFREVETVSLPHRTSSNTFVSRDLSGEEMVVVTLYERVQEVIRAAVRIMNAISLYVRAG